MNGQDKMRPVRDVYEHDRIKYSKRQFISRYYINSMYAYFDQHELIYLKFQLNTI